MVAGNMLGDFMKRNLHLSFLIVVATVLFSTAAFATMWVPDEHTCPVCGKKAEYMEIMSEGGYIYDWPSKYQYIFWPKTDENFIFCCPKCHYSAYMWDFDKLPKDRVEEVRKVLVNTVIPKAKHYYDIPMTIRLGIAEKVYSALGKSDVFWCDFFRIKGYWCEKEKNNSEARDSRKKALSYADNLLRDHSRAGETKALLYISGSMHYFLDAPDLALAFLKKATEFEYSSSEMTQEENKNTNDFLDKLLKDFIDKVEKKQPVPRE